MATESKLLRFVSTLIKPLILEVALPNVPELRRSPDYPFKQVVTIAVMLAIEGGIIVLKVAKYKDNYCRS